MLLLDIVSKYIRTLKREKLHAPRTIISYESDLKLFAQFVGESRAIYEISEHLMERYFVNLTEVRQMSSATFSRRVCAVRRFFQYLENEDYILRSPMDRLLLKVKVNRKSPVFITPEEISKLLRVILKEYRTLQQKLSNRRDRGDKDRLAEYQLFCNIRNMLLIRTLLETGIRTGELVNITHDQVHLAKRSGTIYSDKHTNSKYNITNPETLKILKQYQKHVKFYNFQSPYFFFNRNMTRLSTVMVQKIFKRYLKQTGIKRRLTPSSLRHAFAVNLIKQNSDLHYVRDILGYKTFEGLLIYQEYFSDSSNAKRNKK